MTTNNSQLLVLRRDTATGFSRVGFHSELPLGRFEHIALICEVPSCTPVQPDSPFFAEYAAACEIACQLNHQLVEQQQQQNQLQGWLNVPLDLGEPQSTIQGDEFGSYEVQAQKTLYRLTRNVTEVWACVSDNQVRHIQSRYPPREMEMLDYQVWKHHQLAKISELPGVIATGRLIVQESGLWFAPG